MYVEKMDICNSYLIGVAFLLTVNITCLDMVYISGDIIILIENIILLIMWRIIIPFHV
ncbi:MAG: hypothetical protein LBB45_04240 [Methanobrevibacter sp.]|jgi:hypothetical protein|nr:hypothetical protein [Candidatus Methanovirga basalitermitum]